MQPMSSRTFALAALVVAVGTIVVYMVLAQRLMPMPPEAYLTSLVVAVVLSAIAVVRARGWLTIGVLALAVALLSVAATFNFVLMRVPASPSAFVVGQPAPDFTLPDASGRAVQLAEFRGKKPVVLVFYRGYW